MAAKISVEVTGEFCGPKEERAGGWKDPAFCAGLGIQLKSVCVCVYVCVSPSPARAQDGRTRRGQRLKLYGVCGVMSRLGFPVGIRYWLGRQPSLAIEEGTPIQGGKCSPCCGVQTLGNLPLSSKLQFPQP